MIFTVQASASLKKLPAKEKRRHEKPDDQKND
jgi:hypothetical protein